MRQLHEQTRRELQTTNSGESLPIRLFCDNDNCNWVNKKELARVLENASVLHESYTSVDSVEVDKETVQEEVEAGRDRTAVTEELERCQTKRSSLTLPCPWS